MTSFNPDKLIGDVVVTLDYSRLGVAPVRPVLGVRIACTSNIHDPLPPMRTWPVLNATILAQVMQPGRINPDSCYPIIFQCAAQKMCQITDQIAAATGNELFHYLLNLEIRDAMTAAALVQSETLDLAGGWHRAITRKFGAAVLAGDISDDDAENYLRLTRRNQFHYAFALGGTDYFKEGLQQEARSFMNLGPAQLIQLKSGAVPDQVAEILSARFKWRDRDIATALQQYPDWVNGLASYFGARPPREQQFRRLDTRGDKWQHSNN